MSGKLKSRSSIGFSITIVVLTLMAGTALALQSQETKALRQEMDLARAASAELVQLRAEHQRLRANQIPAAELETLRADHAALPRLRAEVEALQKRAAIPAR